jgi:hypothetical protein
MGYLCLCGLWKRKDKDLYNNMVVIFAAMYINKDMNFVAI